MKSTARTGGKVIVGLGVDITEVKRVEAAIRRRGKHFLARIYTPAEIAYCERHKNKYERYAGRFAAKEAAMKALGTGWRHGVRWVDIEVKRLPSGKPTVALAGAAEQFAKKMEVTHISLSITHEAGLAWAMVVFEAAG